jgi:hypothetical protein
MLPIFLSGYDKARSDESNGSFLNRTNGLVYDEFEIPLSGSGDLTSA